MLFFIYTPTSITITNSIMDKEKALEAALRQIEKAYGKGAVMTLENAQKENIDEPYPLPLSLGCVDIS